jgi:hypothetical protein
MRREALERLGVDLLNPNVPNSPGLVIPSAYFRMFSRLMRSA